MSSLAECVARFRASKAEAELEIRMGTYDGGRFEAGVPRDVFEQLEEDLRTALADADDGFTEVVDYHYATKQGPVRTRVTFDAQHMQLSTEHIVKRARDKVVLRGGGCEESGDAVRVAWSTETPLAQLPTGACVPTHVRIKQRRVFRDVRDGHVVWSYELSKTWSAGSRSAVEHLQHLQPPVYEVECELVDAGGHYLATHTDEQVAASLALKAQLLLAEEASLVQM
jgi:hypothetical protein